VLDIARRGTRVDALFTAWRNSLRRKGLSDQGAAAREIGSAAGAEEVVEDEFDHGAAPYMCRIGSAI
jgi:hypothetical protein